MGRHRTLDLLHVATAPQRRELPDAVSSEFPMVKEQSLPPFLGGCFPISFVAGLGGDEASAAGVGDVGECPLEKNEESVAEAD